MPPTPFHPTHTTPFKSSISSSQQTRKANVVAGEAPRKDCNVWPVALTVQDLDPRDWTYLAEGGKNLLLRFSGTPRWPFVTEHGRAMALRVTKSARDGNDQAAADEDIPPLDWQREIILPSLFGASISKDEGSSTSDALLPSLLPLKLDNDSQRQGVQAFLGSVADRIEAMRPLERRRAGGIRQTDASGVFVTEDLGVTQKGMPTIVFEIKPKCGFLPDAANLSEGTKASKIRFSRYRMHQVLKNKGQETKESFEDMYDPLDLYSGDDVRIARAARALYKTWSLAPPHFNNLRVFIDGKKMDERSSVASADLVAGKVLSSCSSLQELFIQVVRSAEVKAVLQAVLEAQKRFDPIDVEGTDRVLRDLRGKGLQDAADEPPITLAEYRTAMAQPGTSLPEARLLLARLLLSTTFKDCSLFVRCSPRQDPSGAAGRDSLDIAIHLVDLDPKPVSKLPRLFAVDQEIVKHFKEWAGRAHVEI